MRKVLSLLVLFLCVATAFAQENRQPGQPSQAEMEAWTKAMTPGEPHKKLQPWVGSWNATIRMWMAPDAPPTESTGTAETRWVLDGRYLEQRFQGSMMGMPFTGLGYTGYDNVKGHYFSTWMDSMSTGVMMANGTADTTGKFWAFAGTASDPMTGKSATFEERLHVISDNEHLFEMWGDSPEGKRFKMMEIRYTRRQ